VDINEDVDQSLNDVISEGEEDQELAEDEDVGE
jgi:hypothetical protein